ncbi:gluconokinase [Segnochrobactraceae bacterium EtOH-i3]
MTGSSVGAGPALLVMGVAGCGKSRIGAAVAARLGARFIEGDAFHPAANITKMQAGIPLDDAHRAGWLDRLGIELAAATAGGGRAVLACSALKRAYRDRLRAAVPGLAIVFLDLPEEVAAARVAARPGHFMPASLVASQVATLERPDGEPRMLRLDATGTADDLVAAAARWAGPLPGRA